MARLLPRLAVVAGVLLALECFGQASGQQPSEEAPAPARSERANGSDEASAAGADLESAGAAADPALENAGQELEGIDLDLEQITAGEQENRLPVTRFETLLEMNRFADAELFDEALPLATRLIELTEEEFGANSVETAEAYQTAARVQRDAGEYDLAEQNYLKAVDLFRAIDGPYTERAISPLIGLGEGYQSAGQHLNAITVFNEARTINRRVFGLLNEGQIPILDRITESFEALDQYLEADEQQLTILYLSERKYPEGSPEHLEALYRYAAWLRESGRYTEERAHYARAMRLVRDMYGRDSLLLVRPLRETANSFREQRLPDNQGLNVLRSALELLENNDAASPLMHAEVLRDLGDWEVAFSQGEPDLEAYRIAWALLGEVDNGESLRGAWFNELHTVIGEPISQRGLSRAPEAVPGYVIVMFDVDRLGRTSDVRVAKSDPVGFKDDAVATALQRWRFRPWMEDGEIVPRDDIALQFNYRYLRDDSQDERQDG